MPPDNVNLYEEAIVFLLQLVRRNGHLPEHRQAEGLLVRIEDMNREEAAAADEYRSTQGGTLVNAIRAAAEEIRSTQGGTLANAIRELSPPPADKS